MERNIKHLKYLDWFLGIPLIFIVGIFRKKRHRPKALRNFGIFAFAALGDSMLSSLLISSIRKKHPDANIIVFASKANASIYSILSGFNELVILPITKPWLVLPILRRHPLDILIDTSQWSRLGALYAVLAKSKWSIGFDTSGQHRDMIYDITVKHSNRCHELENFKRLLAPLGVQPCSEFIFSENISNPKALKIVAGTDKYIVLHPWASGSHHELREWPSSSWSSLAKKLSSAEFVLLISGGSADCVKANKLAQEIDLGDRVQVIAGRTSLAELSNIILHARACISVNTGIAHVAASLGVPTISLNGPTSSRRWGILGKNAINLDVSEEQGGGFLNLGFEYPNNPQYIMDQITVNSVLETLKLFGING